MLYSHPGGETLTRHMLELCGLPPNAKVLDFGCGNGATLVLMRDEFGFDVCGIDADKAAVNLCKMRDASLDVKLCKDNVVDFPSLSLHCIVCECSLSLVEKRDEYLHELWCVLKNGGKLAISDMFKRGDEDGLQTEFESVGFKMTVWEYHSQDLKNYAAQLLMDGKTAECEQYGSDTSYFMAILEKC